jgi:predicted GNAT family N-acyltransferase
MQTVRLATAEDAATLSQLRFALRSKPGKDIETKTAFLLRCREWMAHNLLDEMWRCWVVEEENAIMGALWLQLIKKIPNPTSETEFLAYITNVFVKETARGRGLASTLLKTALAFCEEQKVQTVILWPTEKSRPLYERHGFGIRPDVFELILGSD